jgi:hypothetical protein
LTDKIDGMRRFRKDIALDGWMLPAILQHMVFTVVFSIGEARDYGAFDSFEVTDAGVLIIPMRVSPQEWWGLGTEPDRRHAGV